MNMKKMKKRTTDKPNSYSLAEATAISELLSAGYRALSESYRALPQAAPLASPLRENRAPLGQPQEQKYARDNPNSSEVIRIEFSGRSSKLRLFLLESCEE
jgi:hypothetical protein